MKKRLLKDTLALEPNAVTNPDMQNLIFMIMSRTPLIYVVTSEEDRFMKELDKIQEATKTHREIYTWSITEGIRGRTRPDYVFDDVSSPIDALDHVLNFKETSETEIIQRAGQDVSTVWVMKDMHPYFCDEQGDPVVRRKIRDLGVALQSSRPQDANIIFLSPCLSIPEDMKEEFEVIEFALPTREDIRTAAEDCIRTTLSKKGGKGDPPVLISDLVKLTADDWLTVTDACAGLTLPAAKRVMKRCLSETHTLSSKFLLSQKQQIIKRQGLLEYVEHNLDRDDIGGLANLKDWLEKRRSAFNSPHAREFGLPFPKGALLLGIPGTGKSLAAKVSSTILNAPLLRLDVGKIFGSLVGESEGNMRKAIQVAEAIGQCILWLDELEKGFSGGSGGSLDGGTTQRVFGTFLTWLAEHTTPVFVIATANDVSLLPPELMRKGRLDEIFYTDLPTVSECEEILVVHIRKLGRDPRQFNLSQMADVANERELTGAEIEQALVSCLFDAYDEGKDLETVRVAAKLQTTVGVSQTSKEKMTSMRKWVKNRAVPASAPDEVKRPRSMGGSEMN